MHAKSSLSRATQSSIRPIGLEKYSWASSAYKCMEALEHMLGRSFIKRENSNGSNIDRCGTPERTAIDREFPKAVLTC